MPDTSVIPNVLAERYASAAARALWSPVGRILAERDLWLAVLRAQADLGLPVTAATIAAYEATRDRVDLADIDRRERVLRHDVKARLESWNAVAGVQGIHQGMTSRDLTENVEQLQVYRTLELLRVKVAAVLWRLGGLAEAHATLPIAARTHHVVAQPTTWGRRLAMFGEELLHAAGQLDHVLASYPVRGLKGAVGTQLDLLTLCAGDTAKVEALEDRILTHLGLPAQWRAPGQVYPRSLDAEVVATYLAVVAPASSFATTLRLMAGAGLASEGFGEGQVGSSAMPHKMNARTSERLGGLYTLLQGYQTMASALGGHQWNEGDVSCSVVRRVLLPDSALCTDAALETWLTILDEMAVIPEAVAAELAAYAPFLASTTLLMEAVKAGAGREAAHHALKEHSVAALQAMRAGTGGNDLPARLAADARLRLSRAQIDTAVAGAAGLTGRAADQARAFAEAARRWASRVPGAATLRPEAIR